MIDFTLYCFTQVFHLTYSREFLNHNQSHLLNWFLEYEMTADTLAKIVSGISPDKKRISAISISEKQAKNYSEKFVKYVYRKVIRKPAGDQEVTCLLQELLKYALGRGKEVQRKIYVNRKTEEVVNYIDSIKKMEETEFQSDENFLEKFERPEIKNISDFFSEYLKLHREGKVQIEEISIAFLGGTRWLPDADNNTRSAILREIHDLNINFNIMITGVSQTGETPDIQMKSLSVPSNIKSWYNYQRACPELKVCVSQSPVMHSYYQVKLIDNKSESAVKILFYTYGNKAPSKCYTKVFTGESPFYDLYRNEFAFLWKKAIDINDFFEIYLIRR